MGGKKIQVKHKTKPSDVVAPLDLRVQLRSCSSLNEAIIKVMSQLIEQTKDLRASAEGAEKTQHGRRLASFQKALTAIKEHPVEITSGKEALTLKNVGKGVANRIDEILKTGTLSELKEHVSEEAKIIQDLTTITGVGEARAKVLMDTFHVKSARDLIKRYKNGEIPVAKNALTHHIVVGITYYDDIKERMMWEEANAIISKVSGLLDSMNRNYVYKFCGSYRRRKPTCGDLDLLVTQQKLMSNDELARIVQELTSAGILVGHLTENGTTKYMGVCKLSPESTGRRIDIRFVPYESMGASMLYFTGSGNLNKLMRHHANTIGYTLNEYGLYEYNKGKKGKEISAHSEKDIFKLLNLVYLEPHEREF